MASKSYEIYYDQVLGTGAYGKVCKAKCGQLLCAAKLLNHDILFQDSDPGTNIITSKFQQEWQFLSTIKHPNIIQYLGSATDPQSQQHILFMELMDESLTRFLERLTGPLPYHSQLNICHDVALALAYLHSNGIIHRNLSSNNVLLIGEGSRTKVTDFGMSKLNPSMPQHPGISVYMPPEVLTTPLHYSSQLDCFSHGVLTLQIITRNFPNLDANRRYSTRRPEAKRRKKDIDLIDPTHPLLPMALQCLKDRDTERPPADELCGSLASLKMELRYTHSVEETRGHVERLKHEIEEKNNKLESVRADHQIELTLTLQKLQEVEQIKSELVSDRVALASTIASLEQEVERNNELVRERADYQRAFRQLQDVFQATAALPLMKLTWRQGKSAPESMSSHFNAAVVRGNTAYFSNECNVYSYTVSEDKWTKLQPCKYQGFALAVINGQVTTVGGHDSEEVDTNCLLCLCMDKWQEVFPPMQRCRSVPATATTPTNLVVAGGLSEHNYLTTVEVLNTVTLQWSKASGRGLPQEVYNCQMMLRGESLYLSVEDNVFSCSVEDLLKSCETPPTNSSKLWTRLADVPQIVYGSALAVVRGRILAIGGTNRLGCETRDIYCYDMATNLWSAIGKMPTPRTQVQTAVLPGDELVAVGGDLRFMETGSTITEIGTLSIS